MTGGPADFNWYSENQSFLSFGFITVLLERATKNKIILVLTKVYLEQVSLEQASFIMATWKTKQCTTARWAISLMWWTKCIEDSVKFSGVNNTLDHIPVETSTVSPTAGWQNCVPSRNSILRNRWSLNWTKKHCAQSNLTRWFLLKLFLLITQPDDVAPFERCT